MKYSLTHTLTHKLSLFRCLSLPRLSVCLNSICLFVCLAHTIFYVASHFGFLFCCSILYLLIYFWFIPVENLWSCLCSCVIAVFGVFQLFLFQNKVEKKWCYYYWNPFYTSAAVVSYTIYRWAYFSVIILMPNQIVTSLIFTAADFNCFCFCLSCARICVLWIFIKNTLIALRYLLINFSLEQWNPSIDHLSRSQIYEHHSPTKFSAIFK